MPETRATNSNPCTTRHYPKVWSALADYLEPSLSHFPKFRYFPGNSIKKTKWPLTTGPTGNSFYQESSDVVETALDRVRTSEFQSQLCYYIGLWILGKSFNLYKHCIFTHKMSVIMTIKSILYCCKANWSQVRRLVTVMEAWLQTGDSTKYIIFTEQLSGFGIPLLFQCITT